METSISGLQAKLKKLEKTHICNNYFPTNRGNLLVSGFWLNNFGGRHLSTAEPTHPPPPQAPTSPPPPLSFNPSFVTQVVTLLQTTDTNDWTSNTTLHKLLFLSPQSLSPLSLLRITRGLGSTAKALQFFHYIRTTSPSPPDPLPLSSTFQAIFELASREQPESATKLYELFTSSRDQSIPLSINSATLLIQFFGRAGMVEKSLIVYEELDPDRRNIHKSECPPNERTMDIVLAGLLKRNWSGRRVSEEEIVGLVLKLGEHCVFPNNVWLSQLITRLCRSGKSNKAWEFLHDVRRLGGSVEAASCNALLTGLGREHDYVRMNMLLKEMKEQKIQPDVVTFGILINYLCKLRRVDEALEVFKKMRGNENDEISVEPDVVHYNTLIDGLCKVGRQEEGLGLLEQMKSRHESAPNIVTYNCLIDGFCKAGEIERSHELLDQMYKEGLMPNVITLNTLVDGMCKHGRINSAMDFLNQMRQKGLKTNAITYTVLISAFCNANNIDKAMALFDEMLKTGCSPIAIVYYCLISGLSQAGKVDDASSVASMMKKVGFGLDIVSYNVLISGFCRKNRLEKAYEMLKDLEEAGVKPDSVTYNTLISYFSETGDFRTAHTLMRRMVKDGLVPTVVTYGTLIHAYCLVGNLDEAMKIFTDMSSASRVSPNTVIYNNLIDSLCKNKKVEVALSLMDDMKAKGVKPNTNTYNAMFKGLQEINWLEKALRLMDQMTEQACNPNYITMEVLTDWLSAVNATEKLRNFVQGYEVSTSIA
ncbi:unnamed protein product [Ilex paraguariensis]|uniref:Pentatricopeptide repeat-containing protein n=1 Tax=Ilex paraguariensis TaxID=185542 RepID=A0ABC8RTF6_9AQUA